LIPFCSVF